MSYQGKLTNATGQAVPDGNYPMIFRIYNQATGGTTLWMEYDTVATRSGLFNILMGSKTALNLPFRQNCWLGITALTDVEMTPRTQLLSSGYAFRTDSASFADSVGKHGATHAPTGSDPIPGYVKATGDSMTGTLRVGTAGTCGVSSTADTAIFGRGIGSSGIGVAGTGVNAGVMGISGNGGFAVYGDNTAGGVAIGAIGNALIEGNLLVTGTKSAVVNTSSGKRLLYCTESPEPWFEDLGTARLINGAAHVDLDMQFLQTVTINAAHPMQVFVQVKGDCKGVYVVPGLTGFDVKELQGGTSNVSFGYRIIAKRKGYENMRLDTANPGR
jgi:hypothetical protein